MGAQHDRARVPVPAALSKHFHIITSIPNLFVAKPPPHAAAAGDHACAGGARGDAAQPPEGRVGVASLDDLNWKQVLDAFTCTECGRCTAVRPAIASGIAAGAAAAHPRPARPAVPRERGRAAHPRRGAVVVHDLHGVRRGVPGRDRARADDRRHAPQPGRQGRDGPAAPADAPELRRPGQLARQVGARARWTKGLDFKIPDAQGARAVRWFVGDFASFDERAQMTSQAVARVLHDAGVSFGLLYEGERNSATTCAGSARRACSRCSSSRT